ncbi:hypothetical protein DL89DRAFT_266896, partial [Linderina pennispora]
MLMASIRGAGGIGALRKTDHSQTNRSSASPSLQTNASAGDASPGANPSGNLANALASALAQR